MKILLTTTDAMTLNILLENKPQNVNISELQGNKTNNALPEVLSKVFHVVIEFSDPVIQAVIASWLYDKFKEIKGAKKINNQPVGKKNKKLIKKAMRKK